MKRPGQWTDRTRAKRHRRLVKARARRVVASDVRWTDRCMPRREGGYPVSEIDCLPRMRGAHAVLDAIEARDTPALTDALAAMREKEDAG